MVARRSVFLLYLAFSLVTLVQRGYGDPEDALKENSSVKQRWDHVRTTTKRPGTTTAPAKPAASDFDLADALDGWNDQDDGHRKPNVGGREGLDADYVKGENLEAVVCEEPQVKYLELPPQSSEAPQPQPPRI
ncbi:CD99 molecule like 2 [Phyllostomus discolor]|uniref:CD99 antigen-like protein 2 n=1 Tax=Phyllostomus discolor TaxID=89673 RepID=A0A834DRS8_9CHIR|nr:CD99 molecule like 2 [Phyllostomus discolor]